MEEKGWLQGSLISAEDVKTLANHLELSLKDGNTFLIVASQSCDVAHLKEENIEFSIATEISEVSGDYTFNKNPRQLNIIASDESGTREFPEVCLQLLAHEKISIPKAKLLEANITEPCITTVLDSVAIRGYVDWLASRYNRPALPSEFDRRFDSVWGKSKRTKASRKLNEVIKGIYVEIDPFKEILEYETYNVNLLAIITEDVKNDRDTISRVEKLMKEYADKMEEVNIKVVMTNVVPETGISLARFKRYKRFYMDNLSYKDNHPLPSELSTSI